MLSYIAKRILGMFPVFFFVALVSFGIICLFPGDYYTSSLFGFALRGMSLDDAYSARQALRVASGLDKPWIVQFWVWFQGVILDGDWGVSWKFLLRPENGLLWTLVLTGSSMIWAWLLGVPLGVLSALRKRSWLDNTISVFTYAGFAFPQFVWGWVFFWVVFRLINPLVVSPGIWGFVGYELVGEPLTWYKVGSHILHLIPAWMIIGAPMFAMVVRHVRGGVFDTLNEQYIVTARSKGLGESKVLLKHALRNALNPLVSMFGVMLPTLIVGSILVAEVLGMDSFGALFISACRSQSQHTLTACLLFYSSFLLVGNLISDLLLAALDPRIRYD